MFEKFKIGSDIFFFALWHFNHLNSRPDDFMQMASKETQIMNSINKRNLI